MVSALGVVLMSRRIPEAQAQDRGGISVECASSRNTDEVSIIDLVSAALERQPQLRIAREDLNIARAGIAAARTPFLPSVQALIDSERFIPSDGGGPVRVVGNNVIGGPQSYSTYASLNFNWNLFSSGRDVAGYHGAKADERATEAALDSQLAETLMGVLQAYADLYGDQVTTLASAREVGLLEEMKAHADERYRNGHGTAVAVGQASSAVLDGRRSFYHACRDLSDKSAALSRAIGTRLPPGQIYGVGASLPDPAIAQAPGDLERIVESDPDVTTAREKIAAAEAKVKQAHAAFGPSVVLAGRRDYLGQDIDGVDAAGRQGRARCAGDDCPMDSAARAAREGLRAVRAAQTPRFIARRY